MHANCCQQHREEKTRTTSTVLHTMTPVHHPVCDSVNKSIFNNSTQKTPKGVFGCFQGRLINLEIRD
jgi:hypothetical protein